MCVRLTLLLAAVVSPWSCFGRRVAKKEMLSSEALAHVDPINIVDVQRRYDEFLAERTGIPFEPRKYYNYPSIRDHPSFSPVATDSSPTKPSQFGEMSGIEFLDVENFYQTETSRGYYEPHDVNRNVVHIIHVEQYGIRELLSALGTNMVVTRDMVPQLAGILNSTIRESKMKRAVAGLLGAFAFKGGSIEVAVPLLANMISQKGRDKYDERNEIEAAVSALEAAGSQAVPAMSQLGDALEHGYFVIREDAAKAFKNFGKAGLAFAPKVAALLKQGGVEQDPREENYKYHQVQVPAAQALLEMSPECTVAAPQLAEALGDEYWLLAETAGKALQKMGSTIGEEAVRMVAKSLEAQMISESGNTGALAAVKVLAAAGKAAAPAAPVLASAMIRNASSSMGNEVSQTAAAILTDLAEDPSSPLEQSLWDQIVQSLADAVSQPTKDHGDSEQIEIKINSAAILEARGPLAVSAASKLSMALKSSSGDLYLYRHPNYRYVTVALAHALLSIAPQHVIDHLVEMLEHKDCIVRVFAANSLGRLGKEAKIAAPAILQGVRRGLSETQAAACSPTGLLPEHLAKGYPRLTVACGNATDEKWRCGAFDPPDPFEEASQLPDWMKHGWDGLKWYPVTASIHALGAIQERVDGLTSTLTQALMWNEYRSEAFQVLAGQIWWR